MRRKTNTRVMAWMLVLTLSLGLTSTAFAASMGVVRMPTKDGSVYLRSGGGTKYPPIGYANHGDLLKILSEGRNWDRVTMTSGVGKGKTGWMSNKYITNLKDVTDMSGWGRFGPHQDQIRRLYGQPAQGAGHFLRGEGFASPG